MLVTHRLQQVLQKHAHLETIAVVVALDDVIDQGYASHLVLGQTCISGLCDLGCLVARMPASQFHYLRSDVRRTNKMRRSLVMLLAVASLNQAHAEAKVNSTHAACSYTLASGETYQIPAGQTLCWRVPPPSYKAYTLLRCDPPFQELSRVQLGDGRCNRYEERQ